MSNPPQTKAMQEKRRLVLYELYKTGHKIGEEFEYSSGKIAKTLGLPDVRIYVQTFEARGIISRRFAYGTKATNDIGRHYFWTIRVPLNEAEALLERTEMDENETLAITAKKLGEATRKRHAANRRTTTHAKAIITEKVAVRLNNGEPVEAIVGPEPTSPMEVLRGLRKDESHALVEAARQYRDRDSKMDTSMAMLIEQAKALGVGIDIEALRGIVTIERDERLEAVALVLPYVDQLERENARLTNENTNLRKDAADVARLTNENKHLNDKVKQLISRAVVGRTGGNLPGDVQLTRNE